MGAGYGTYRSFAPAASVSQGRRTLVLAFTGMRDGEAGALQTGCAGRRTEDGETVFYVRSLLSKTDDNAISLDWIANEIAWSAVELLSRVNELYYERARLILQHYGGQLTAEERTTFAHGCPIVGHSVFV